MTVKLPSFQFYPGDWMKDPALRACTIAARGIWIDMLSLMFESSRRGYLQHVTGKPVTAEQLARITGCSTDEVSRLLQELEDAGVFSRTDSNVIFSRRMSRDERKRALCQEAGKRGGNPTLKGQLKGDAKGTVKGQPKGDANLNPTPSSSSSSSTSSSEEKPPNPPKPGAAIPGRRRRSRATRSKARRASRFRSGSTPRRSAPRGQTGSRTAKSEAKPSRNYPPSNSSQRSNPSGRSWQSSA